MAKLPNHYGLKRLKSKEAKSAIIQKLSSDFNLTPIIAEAFYQQFTIYFNEHANVSLSSGEIVYEAVSAEEPAGKHIRLTKKISVRLKLIDFNTDLEVLASYGLAGLRRHRLARLTQQTYDQRALLSHEDLAMILTTSPATIKRDIYFLKKEGLFIMTRGTKLDMGPGLSHQTIILDLYFNGYTFTEIENKTNHSETSVKRYLADFIQIATLHKQNFSKNQIPMIAQKSDRIVRQYLQLDNTFDQQNNQRLLELFNPQKPGSESKKNIQLNHYQRINKMAKNPTKQQIQLKKMRRLKNKSLHQLLLHRFLNHYGYDKGEITAHAIIDDILKLIDQYFLVSTIDDDLHHLHYGQLVWMALPVDQYPQRGKTIAQTKMKPLILSFINNQDIEHISMGFDSKSLRKNRLQRWVDEASDQGALLTQLDLAILLGVCDAVVSQYVNEIQKNGTILPTRGNIHDLSAAITHKKEIITLFLEGYLTPDIAIKTKHSKEAVDRYIKDYHRVLTLWKHDIKNIDKIAQLARLSKKLVMQYVDLLPDKYRKKMSKISSNHDQFNLDSS